MNTPNAWQQRSSTPPQLLTWSRSQRSNILKSEGAYCFRSRYAQSKAIARSSQVPYDSSRSHRGKISAVGRPLISRKYFAEMETDLDPDLPQVYCQVDEINQVVLNMIINAAQAIQQIMPKNSEEKGKIKISTFTRKNNVLITVADTGSGIPESIRDRIFDPFFTTKEIGKGTGQGLALAHNIIVKKHGGRIDVQSEPGKGTIFTIELKVENPEEGEL